MRIQDFLLDRIAEEEALAKEAAGIDEGFEGGDRRWCPRWLYSAIRHVVRNCDIECSTHEDDLANCGQPHRYAGEHVARHDPERVLRDCEARRRIIAEHSNSYRPREDVLRDPKTAPVDVEVSSWGSDDIRVQVTYADGRQEQLWYPEYRDRFMEPSPPSQTLRLLALPYIDHPDYDRENWSPK